MSGEVFGSPNNPPSQYSGGRMLSEIMSKTLNVRYNLEIFGDDFQAYFGELRNYVSLANALRTFIEDAADSEQDIDQIIGMAIAFGRVSMTVEHRQNERAYATGKKNKEVFDAGRKKRKIPTPKNFKAIVKAVSQKTPKKTRANKLLAEQIGVSVRTIERWRAELKI